MEYEGMESIVCDAEENDWLDVSYSERKYVGKSAKKAKAKRQIKFKFNKKITVIAVAILCVAALALTLFIDGNFSKDVFNAAKTAYSSVIFGGKQEEPVSAKIQLPSNVNLVDVSEEGVATFDGGRAVMSFTAGKVTEVTENSVTVAIDDSTSVVYGNVAEVYVAVDDVVSVNGLLGKYDGNFTATISVSGETVKEVVGSDTQLTWNV